MKRPLMHWWDALAWTLLATAWALAGAGAARVFWRAGLAPTVGLAAGVCWFVAFALGAGVEAIVVGRRGGWRGRLATTAGAQGVACAALVVWLRWKGTEQTGFPVAHGAILLGLWLLAQRAWLLRAVERQQARAGAECLRILLLAGAVLATAWPFCTANFTGGMDARWYAYTLHDYLQQIHAGVFPVLVGQGEFAFNGAIHPFRSAPYFHNFAGLLDWLTARTLGTFALQHLAVVVSGLAAAFSAYGCLLAFAPQRRWTACLVAVAYVLCPVFWGLISMYDAYMAFMAMPWLPVLFYGVMRMVGRGDTAGGVLVAVTLSLLWACHSPVALWSTLTVLGMLGLAWLAHGRAWGEALALARCLALLAGLSAFQFYGMAELTAFGDGQAPSTAYGVGIVSWLVLWTILHWAVRRRGPRFAGERNAGAEALLWAGAGLVALAVMAAVRGLLPFAVHPAVTATLDFVRKLWPGMVSPVTLRMESDIQPGYALCFLGLLVAAGALLVRELRLVLLAAGALAFALILLPVPMVTKFLWGHLPISILVATSGAVSLRLAPVWVTGLAFGGFLALARLADRSRWGHRAAVAILAGLVVFAGVEAQKFARFTERLTYGRERSEDVLRTENAQLFIYSYNFVYLPADFSHGVVDYHLASHVLDLATGEANPGLGEHRDPPPGEVRMLTEEFDPVNPGWLLLSPPQQLEPGKRIVARFTFAAPEPQGLLTISGLHFYREYILPSLGGARSFGAGPENSRELSLWNTSPVAYPIEFRLLPSGLPRPAGLPRLFARMEWREVPDESLPVQTVSLIPSYRARIDAKVPALLETPRVFVPGYVATRNGRPVEVARSRENRVAVLLESGPNDVEIRFVGSPGLHRAAWVSLVCWLGVGFWGMAKIARTSRA